MSQKTNFKIALALAGITQLEWAKRQGVTYQAVSQNLRGTMASKRLTSEIEHFVNQEFQKLRQPVSPKDVIKTAQS